MRFDPPPRRTAPEPLLPLINVVFLLLIFFLISARLAPPDPVAVVPPLSDAAQPGGAEGPLVLYLAADGTAALGAARGPAALAALAAARAVHCARADCAAAPPALVLRADAGLPAAALAPVLRDLAALGFAGVRLVTAAGG
jgi:biopolymer transport protein ExbD